MQLQHWFLLIGLMVGMGMLRTAQQNALIVSGYALGDRAEQLHEQDVQMKRLRADVLELASPVHLADVARERRMKLVAWTSVQPAKPMVLPRARQQSDARATSMLVASREPNDTAD